MVQPEGPSGKGMGVLRVWADEELWSTTEEATRHVDILGKAVQSSGKSEALQKKIRKCTNVEKKVTCARPCRAVLNIALRHAKPGKSAHQVTPASQSPLRR